MGQHSIKYRTFDQLLEDVSIDFSQYSLEGMIEPQQLIKIATRVNYDLGLRIHQTKEVVLEVEHGKVKLPSDFYVLNFGMMASKRTITQPEIHGSHIHEVVIGPKADCVPTAPTTTTTSGVDELYQCQPEGSCINQCGEYYQLVQTFKTKTVTYEQLDAIKIKPSSSVSADCPNTRWSSPYQAEIRNGWMYTSFKTGKVYINYLGAMENEEGELLVMDHPMVNEYYEYAVKQRILENLYMNGEDVAQKMNLIEGRLRGARNNALSYVNTPNFGELKKMWEVNRKAQYHKYVNMFKSFPTVG